MTPVVTAEQIEAGRNAVSGFMRPEAVTAIYLAMKALDPTVNAGVDAGRDWEAQPLSANEHIAADIRAGRFPKQSHPEQAMREIEATQPKASAPLCVHGHSDKMSLCSQCEALSVLGDGR